MRTCIGARYDLIEEIGSGAMGSVWRGYDTVLDREVAVKLIRLSQARSSVEAAELVARFHREARVTARIRHSGVPQVFDAILDAEVAEVCLVMEFIADASPLQHYLDRKVELPVGWAVAVAAQIATTLAYAHALPVVHRDLKPDNILLVADGAVKIIDFGLAALLTSGVPKLTMTGMMLGTVAYMSPEQGLGVKPTPRSDLYALGCVLFEMLCGRSVFVGSAPAVAHGHAFVEPTSPAEIRADVPPDLNRLVLELLAKSPEQRPSDAEVVFDRLLALLQSCDLREQQAPAGFPDPVELFRRPNGPRHLRFGSIPFRAVAPYRSPIADRAPDEPLRAAEMEYQQLVDEGRFLQAADVLTLAAPAVATASGSEMHRALDIRRKVAQALLLGGEFRRAGNEFEHLAEEYALLAGHGDDTVLDCRKAAVNCRAELGELAVAVADTRALLVQVRESQSDGGQLALELRVGLGRMLTLLGDQEEAAAVLDEVYADLVMIRGADDVLTCDAMEAIDQLTAMEPPST
ncbi:serine/threonine-protein kinase [Nocardia sp. NPDC059177]|uniref:serine/threonine-protein kinase n=1 Tax=Nocardia sp. NPDC059177 TaxID=3346759 RepID=UPI0036C423D2